MKMKMAIPVSPDVPKDELVTHVRKSFQNRLLMEQKKLFRLHVTDDSELTFWLQYYLDNMKYYKTVPCYLVDKKVDFHTPVYVFEAQYRKNGGFLEWDYEARNKYIKGRVLKEDKK